MTPWKVALLSYSPSAFALLDRACRAAGHEPVVYAYGRSRRLRQPAETVTAIVEELPAGMDLLLPANGDGLVRALSGYEPDLVVCSGFPWKLPDALLELPGHGAINVHPSLLPRYRGPLPIQWAIRNGDRETGISVHRMESTYDTGRVLAQKGGVRLPDDVDRTVILRHLGMLTYEVLREALRRLSEGHPGEPQDETRVSYADWMEDEFFSVDWSAPARRIHDQVRTFRFGLPGSMDVPGPLARVGDRLLALRRTSLVPGEGVRVECGDGPLWIVDAEAVESPHRDARPADPVPGPR